MNCCCPGRAGPQQESWEGNLFLWGWLWGSALALLGCPLPSGCGELGGGQPEVLGTGWHGLRRQLAWPWQVGGHLGFHHLFHT